MLEKLDMLEPRVSLLESDLKEEDDKVDLDDVPDVPPSSGDGA